MIIIVQQKDLSFSTEDYDIIVNYANVRTQEISNIPKDVMLAICKDNWCFYKCVKKSSEHGETVSFGGRVVEDILYL